MTSYPIAMMEDDGSFSSQEAQKIPTEQTGEVAGHDLASEAGWKWYGYGGHFIGSKSCAFHLATRIGNFLVSTVGDYRPRGGERETLGASPDSFFETYVFECDGDTEDGDPNIQSWSEIDGERYSQSILAERGHYNFCWKYSAILRATGDPR